MIRFNPTQLADITARCQRMLDHTRQAMRENVEPRAFGQGLVNEMTEVMLSYGWAGVAFCVRSWADALVTATPGAEVGKPVRIAFTSPDHTEMVPNQFILPERKWAADIIAARFAGDQARLYRGISGLPADRRALVYLYAMVEMVACALNEYDSPTDGPIKGGLYVEDPTTGMLHHVEATP